MSFAARKVLGFGLVCIGLTQVRCGPDSATGTPPSQTATASQAIVGGTPSADGRVWQLRIQLPFQTGYCSASLISTNVLLTAAHCTAVPAGAVFSATPSANAASGPWFPVRSTDYDSRWDGNPGDGHDVGIAVLATPYTAVAPLRLIKTDWELVNVPLRVVGYGVTSYGGQDSGNRLETYVWTEHEDPLRLFTYDDPNHMWCDGDSGGPGMATVRGYDRLMGVISGTVRGGCSTGVLSRPEASDGFLARYNNTALVQAWYAMLLGRQAEDGGLIGWTLALDEGTPRLDVTRNLIAARERHDWVTRNAYSYALDRYPKPAEYDFYANASERDLWISIYSSAEFIDRVMYCCPSYIGDWIAALYRYTLRYQPTYSEIQPWFDVFSRKGFAGTAAQFLDTHQVHARYVDDLYETALLRAPDSGREGWISSMDQGTSREDTYAGFLAVDEFRDRVASQYDY